MDSTQITLQCRDFIATSPTPFHATANMAQVLVQQGFRRLEERKAWNLSSGGYFVQRGGALIAFFLPDGDPIQTGIRIIGSHTDSPGLKITPKPDIHKPSGHSLGIEVYGAPLLNTWFDRDLSFAGRVVFEQPGGGLETALIQFKEAMAHIPSLAIHLNREAKGGRAINPFLEMRPLLHHAACFADLLLEKVRQEQAPDAVKIIGHDMLCYDTQEPLISGSPDDIAEGRGVLLGARLDNLISVFASLHALISSEMHLPCLIIANDHEEVGSASSTGAGGSFLEHSLMRIAGSQEAYYRMLSTSRVISADNTHAVHPNYTEKHDPLHAPQLGAGVAIKTNAKQRYASELIFSSEFEHMCSTQEIAIQHFVARADMPCGSTIGPITATRTGMTTLDIGIPTLGMHSIRETAACADISDLGRALRCFYEYHG